MTIVNHETGELVNTFDELETIIENGLHTFIEVGNALTEIRDRGLYRNGFDNFEAYCADRWNLSRKRAYDLMGAAETVKAMSPIGDIEPPRNEAQARELAPLKDEPGSARKVWQDVQEQSAGKPTAAIVRAAVKRHLSAVPAPAPVDEKFWNDAAAKATESGWVAKKDAERPYSLAISGLVLAAADITGISLTPTELAENIPAHDVARLPDIEAAAEWLNTFIAAHKESV